MNYQQLVLSLFTLSLNVVITHWHTTVINDYTDNIRNLLLAYNSDSGMTPGRKLRKRKAQKFTGEAKMGQKRKVVRTLSLKQVSVSHFSCTCHVLTPNYPMHHDLIPK